MAGDEEREVFGEEPDEESETEDAEQENKAPEVYTLKVLKVIKEAQQKHGLRHGDYQRYRSYCTRRIRRLRKYLHFVQGNKKHFRKKNVTEEVLKDEKYLYIPLMGIERAWSYAMQLKQEANTEPRKRYHLASRLRKAAQTADMFQKLTDQSVRCDARTKLEVQAYTAYIKGTLNFEMRHWKEAMEEYTKAQTIYEKLAAALNEDEAIVYRARAEELVPPLRFCAYSVGDKSAGEELMNMRTGHNEMLDTLIAETRAHQAAALSEVTWRGRTIGVQNEKVRTFLLNAQEFKGEEEGEERKEEGTEGGSGAEERLERYERLLMECKDAINIVKEELRQDPVYKQYQPGGDTPVTSLHFLHTYLSYLRLTTTIQRNLTIIDSTEQKLHSRDRGTDGRRARVQDLIRLYEIILQNLQEIPLLAGLEADLEIRSGVQAQISAYKGFRCYHVAQSYASNQRWPEAMALYERVESYCQNALQSELEPALKARVERLLADVQGRKYAVQARSILAAEELTTKTDQLRIADKSQLALCDRLDEYLDTSDAADLICPLPPQLEPIPCKPLFFDLALNHAHPPDLTREMGQVKGPEAQSATAQQGGGLTGLVRGLWGWGKK